MLWVLLSCPGLWFIGFLPMNIAFFVMKQKWSFGNDILNIGSMSGVLAGIDEVNQVITC